MLRSTCAGVAPTAYPAEIVSSRLEKRLRSTAERVEHPGMPLIRVVEGRQVLRRIKRDLAHVDARVRGGFRHWGRGQHPSPEKGGRDDERGSKQRKFTCHDPLLVIGCPFRSTVGVLSWPSGRSALAHRGEKWSFNRSRLKGYQVALRERPLGSG